MQPDLEPLPEPTVPTPCQITCPQCGYTVVELDRALTADEIARGLDRLIADQQATIDRLNRRLSAIGR